jgi:hypothetical protein
MENQMGKIKFHMQMINDIQRVKIRIYEADFRVSMVTIEIFSNYEYWEFLEISENRQNWKNLGIFLYVDVSMMWEPCVK